jgi:hypothetical protein
MQSSISSFILISKLKNFDSTGGRKNFRLKSLQGKRFEPDFPWCQSRAYLPPLVSINSKIFHLFLLFLSFKTLNISPTGTSCASILSTLATNRLGI